MRQLVLFIALGVLACRAPTTESTAPPAPRASPTVATSIERPADQPKQRPSSIREQTPLVSITCFENGRRLDGLIGADDPRCPERVSVSIGDFAVFDADHDPDAEPAIVAELSRRAQELEQCYLDAFTGSGQLPWVVIPVVATASAAGTTDKIEIDAGVASDSERGLLDCVYERLASWRLQPESDSVRFMFAVIMDPYRGARTP